MSIKSDLINLRRYVGSTTGCAKMKETLQKPRHAVKRLSSRHLLGVKTCHVGNSRLWDHVYGNEKTISVC